MAVYRDYDQAALDAQYNNRTRVPDFDAIVARWRETSAADREALGTRLDQRYGDGPREDLDFFAAESAGGTAPLLAFIHGGYWQSLSKDVFAFVARGYIEAGIAVANIGYPLAPDATMDEIVASVRRAMLWLSGNATDLGCDPGRLFLSGHSAGGHLTAMMAATDWSAIGGRSELIAGGCPISGLYDLEPLRLSYLNENLRLDPGQAERNSPVRLVPDRGPPLLISVGGEESEEFHCQQDAFVGAWRAMGLSCTVVESPGCDHFSVLDSFAMPGRALHDAVRRQILG